MYLVLQRRISAFRSENEYQFKAAYTDQLIEVADSFRNPNLETIVYKLDSLSQVSEVEVKEIIKEI